MEFQKLLFKRKSIRKYQNKSIEPAKVEQLKKAALLSPTGKRKNHWDFIFIENKETLKHLSESKMHGSKLIGNAALAVAVIGDSEVSDTWIEDCSIASIMLQLQGEDLGLGSCWVQINKRAHDENTMAEDYVKELLKIPEDKNVLSIVAFGYPDEKRPANNEDELLWNKIHTNIYGH
ncbi:MAG: nitroreductase family protein [Salinivirgaceae bacterium]